MMHDGTVNAFRGAPALHRRPRTVWSCQRGREYLATGVWSFASLRSIAPLVSSKQRTWTLMYSTLWALPSFPMLAGIQDCIGHLKELVARRQASAAQAAPAGRPGAPQASPAQGPLAVPVQGLRGTLGSTWLRREGPMSLWRRGQLRMRLGGSRLGWGRGGGWGRGRGGGSWGGGCKRAGTKK